MADKKESALGAVTDFAQARVLDASGASKNIDKATMASVLAATMGVYPLKAKLSDSGNYLSKGNGNGTFGLIFACNDSGSYCMASYRWNIGADGTFNNLAGDLNISRINEYGTVVIEGATIFAAIYFNIDDV